MEELLQAWLSGNSPERSSEEHARQATAMHNFAAGSAVRGACTNDVVVEFPTASNAAAGSCCA